MIFILEDS